MKTAGDMLREAREAKGLSVSELYQSTRIRPALITALESNEFDEIPGGPVYVRGFIRTLCQALDLNYDDVVKEIPMAAAAAPLTPAPVSGRNPVQRPNWLTWGMLIAVILLALAGGYYQFFGPGSRVDTPNVDPPAAVTPDPLPEPEPPPEPEPVPDPEPFALQISESEGRRVYEVFPWPPQLEVRVLRESCWIRVVSDGEQLVSTTLTAGAIRTYSADEELYIRLGNPGVVALTVNGIPLGDLPDRLRDYLFVPASP